ncbi:hypothetical protein D6833_07305, partial [Candidatus Parcubacteria bacterium]
MRETEYERIRQEFIREHTAFPPFLHRLPGWMRPYLLLVYWTFFKPSALRIYLYHIAPPQARKEEGFRVSWRGVFNSAILRQWVFRAVVM